MFEILLKREADAEEAWREMEEKGIVLLYSVEENGKVFLYADSPVNAEDFAFIDAVKEKELPSIDWEEQWKLHGQESFEAGGASLRLNPGGGFGDLSHPTTRLMLKMMPEIVEGKRVADIGCGSGVLSIAAAALGAERVFAVDISEEAVAHAKENIRLNGFEGVVEFSVPQECDLILMNMIWSEQKIAWEGLYAEEALTSGIRLEEREDYLLWMEKRGWKLFREEREGAWCGFFFQRD